MASLKYSANAQFQIGTLASGYTSGGTSLVLTAGHGARFPAAGDFWVRVEDEIFKVTSRATDTLTVTGAQDGTSAADHASAANVSWVLSVSALTQLRADIIADGAVSSNSIYSTYAAIRATAPTSAEAGKIAYCSDSTLFARWSGTAWQWFWRGIPVIPPVVTGQTTTESGAITNVATSLTVSAQFASMPSVPFFIMIGTEQLKVTAAASTTWTVTRGDGGTVAAAHNNGDTVTEMLYSWSDFSSSFSSYNNAGGQLIVENYGSLGSTDGGVKMKTKLLYSAPWTVIAAVGFHFPQGINYVGAGLALWDVAQPAKDVRDYVAFYNGGWFSTFEAFSWAGAGSNAVIIAGGTVNAPYGASTMISNHVLSANNPGWVKIVDDNTNWIFYRSDDKIVWREMSRVARNTTLTATHVGPFCSPRFQRAGAVLLSLEQFNSVV